MTFMKWIVVADDLSGATELAGVASRRGMRVQLTRGCDIRDVHDAEAWVVDTQSREEDVVTAAGRIATIARVIARVRTAETRVFKKIDSVMRGYCGLESELLAVHGGMDRIVVVPGNPSRNRLVRDGRLWVDDQSLEDSRFRHDPSFPALSAEISRLWRDRGAEGRVATHVPRQIAAHDLPALAACASEPRVLPAGAADFFEACLSATGVNGSNHTNPDNLVPRGCSLVVCGSRDAWEARRAHFASRGWSWAERGAPTRLDPGLMGLGTRHLSESATALRDLAEGAAERVRGARPALLCLEGGQTASLVLDALHWDELHVVGEVAPGVAALQAAGASTIALVKPGSYAWPDLVQRRWAECAGTNGIG